ncbi:adenosylmethionine-8-amino-7-oxononanoate aminotransferase [Anoxybacillus voinovskiensis]|uniref:Adenosylmethionine-8-amino-7-oxononanoate aminotransferase n=1 Tax=Anoxybacteroides voinovskiense TaxID=230470 RepID=A0A840DVB2_9BACL|nr:aspartate aminotransferase family protein [Anoxybacillus voinovskiensis]MBB4073948.1 adenosylmethionine-8-amino-7-oxononanoate aminotransferase [Anoxybacillus voinovskiensis]GGJ65919.1 aspartate aminotransferase family protein [Anoxybacillus voinovskiensis]
MTYLIKPHLHRTYPTVRSAKGIYVYDTDGKKYLDGCSGAVTANLGHGVQEVMMAMNKQAEQVAFVYRSQFTSEAAEKLAEALSQQIGRGTTYWTFLVNSGSEATETAMKIAIQYWQEQGRKGKNKILSRWLSYHGITIGALSLSGHPMRRARFVPLLEDFPTISPPYCFRCPYGLTYPSCQWRCADELETAIVRIGAEHIAAFIAEPIIGAAGAAITPPDGYYERIYDICQRHDILFIADEVMTGLGRTGKMMGLDHWNVQADIIALGKGLGAGYTPIAATLASERVMAPIMNGSGVIMSGHTLSANPLSASVALAVLQYIERHHLVQRAHEIGTYLFTKLQNLQKQFAWIGDVRGKGLLLGIEFVVSGKEMVPSDLAFTDLVVTVAQQKGLLVYPAAAGNGKDGAAIIIAPPLTIEQSQVDELIDLLEQTFREVQRRCPGILKRNDDNGSK